jgi:hypothetical protein
MLMYAPNSSWNDPPIFPSIGKNEKKIKLIVDNYDNFSLNMNSDTYNKKIDENLKTTFILQNYDKNIIWGFDIPL